ncbi:MAG: tRNA (adenosine(37)-N6)-threonylcarbamoyltransferase complex dimerization subunit type 1 TsaB [Mariprofundaceae bacterium]
MSFPVLALDAAFGPAAATLILGNDQRFYAESPESKPHSQTILPMCEHLLQQASLTWQSLALLALGIGPGSFTGVRVTAASLAGMNASLKRPLLSLSSLAITAAQAASVDETWVLEDARAEEAYVGCYRKHDATQADTCMPWIQVETLPPASFVCHGTPTWTLNGWQQQPLVKNRAEALADMVLHQLQTTAIDTLPTYTQPAYLQPSQAERNAGHG